MISGPEFFDALLERARAVAELLGAHVYQVVGQVGDQLTVRPLSLAQGLPDELVIDKAHGLAGAREICVQGELVLVTWRGGDNGAPIVVGYLPGVLPSEIELDAQTQIRIGPSIGDLSVLVGGGDRPVAMGDTIEAWLTPVHEMLRLLGQYTDTSTWTAPDQAAWTAAVIAEAELHAAGEAEGWSSTRLATR